MRQSLYDLLFENGFEPVPLRGSQDFFALGDDVKLDLALIDLRLDGESGLTLTRSIHQNLALPIVMLTGVGDDTDKILGLETGADDYILKPFNPSRIGGAGASGVAPKRPSHGAGSRCSGGQCFH